MAPRDNMVIVGKASVNVPDFIMNIICTPEHFGSPAKYMSFTSRIVKYKWHEDVLKSMETIRTRVEKNKFCPIE